ncbi:tRNA (adenosine(37)-N6)-dimethylallyltransferase MiaA [Candidatus Berkelbacteria bacterium RBG_13_40_8]|uniref:tRNA dimethylallyltransferase n=1 Tax=Candidatus Berkelbacteria bacterium RBG_13_40_8 TaxID=1797467 RepID=A0A1F5DM07_9BACT|nr:MAG: tRNA (adenosine(37)-N6)-dimethylallyltransferase MiaA [Candidatus Berkelbacteria bacterium RBG_13_40_8]
MKNNKIIAIVGPTGSGKTAWAKILARKFNGQVISCDSRQIYRGMDIGTGKDKSFQQGLIDIATPDKIYSVKDYQEAANKTINQYLGMKALPMLVGGTGLYLEAVLYGYVIPGLKMESLELRKKLEKLSNSELLAQLKKIDPKSAIKIDSKNHRRLIRALEVSILSKKPFSAQKKKRKPKFDALIIGIDTDRETLYAKIDARIEQMIKKGLVEEVRDLTKKYPKDLPALNTIGYKEIVDYISANEIPRQAKLGHLQGKQTLKEAVQKIKFNTHAYVRRQETWFRHDKNVKWVKNISQAEKLIKKFLAK